MILESGAVLAAVVAGVYYVKHHGVAATLASVKLEVSKIESEVAAKDPAIKTEILSVVARVKALL